MNETNNHNEGLNPSTENMQGNTARPDSAPMFMRSAGGQYSDGTQPNSPASYTPNGYYPVAPMPPQENGYAYTPYPLQPTPPKVDRSAMIMGDAVGMPMCMFFIGSYVLSFAIMFVLGLISPNASNLLADPNVNYFMSSCMTLVLLTVPYLFTLKVTKSTFSELVSAKKVAAGKTSALIMLGFGVSAVSNIASNMLASFSDAIFGMQFQSGAPDYGTDIWSFALMMLCVGILPAVLEEFALRGVVLGALRKKFSDGTAIMLSSVLFGLLHGNLVQIPFAFLMGLILGYATVYSGSIIPSVIIHAVNNSISVLLSFASNGMSPMVSEVTGLLYYAVSIVLGLCGFIMLIKTDKNAFKLSHERCEATNKKELKGFFGSGWIIAFIVLSALQIILTQALV